MAARYAPAVFVAIAICPLAATSGASAAISFGVGVDDTVVL